MKKKALISGITGQDGSYLAELLLKKGYEVHGIKRRSSVFNTARIDHIINDITIHYGDVTDALSIDHIMFLVEPDEIYHLGAQSHVKISFEVPGYTAQTDGIGTLNMLEAMRKHTSGSRFYNASTSELFGLVQETPQKETTPFYPRSPYGIAKLYAYWIVKNYREAYQMFTVNGILFNHESERRGSTFVTSKIVNGLCDYIEKGTPFYLGNLYAKRDWGYSPEYVECMWRMLQQGVPEDFVIGTGENHTIKEFVDECLKYINKDEEYIWKTAKVKPYSYRDSFDIEDDEYSEILWDTKNNKTVIGIDEMYYRPAEVDVLLADPSKAKEKLGWSPKVTFKDLVKIMMNHRINVGKI